MRDAPPIGCTLIVMSVLISVLAHAWLHLPWWVGVVFTLSGLVWLPPILWMLEKLLNGWLIRWWEYWLS